MATWCSIQSSDSCAEESSHTPFEFEDNFVIDSDKVTFEKLPDSKEYLEKLEKKLNKISHSKPKTLNTKDFLTDFAKAKEQALTGFVLSSDNTIDNEEIDLDSNKTVNPIARRIEPKQALTVGEEVILVKSDHLEKKEETESDSQN